MTTPVGRQTLPWRPAATRSLSLGQRLALLLVVALVPGFLAAWVAHGAALRDALQEQLESQGKSLAASLAAVFTPLRDDPAALQRAAVAQARAGQVRLVQLRQADGGLLVSERAPRPAETPVTGPDWFFAFFPLAAEPGYAPVADAAGRVAHLEVALDPEPARAQLWRSSSRLGAWLLWLAAAAALAAWALLRAWQRPWRAAAEQARSIARAQWSEAAEARAWPELSEFTRAMNTLVRRVRAALDGHATQVERLQRLAHADPVTGLPVRAQFIGRLGDLIPAEGSTPAALMIVRVPQLAWLNQRHGHDATDRLLVALADVLATYGERVADAAAGRLNGSDFALFLPAAGIARETAESIRAALAMTPAARLAGAQFQIGACEGLVGIEPGVALAAADAALAEAENGSGLAVLGSHEADASGARAWREAIGEALDQGHAELGEFPVIDANGRLLHLECPLRVRMQPEGPMLPARRWLALAKRSQLMQQVDLTAVDLALRAIEADGMKRCVHVWPGSFVALDFVAALQSRLAAAPHAARRLSIEWSEGGEPIDQVALWQAVQAWQALGVRVGIEHAGASPRALPGLRDLGIDYIKVDGRHVRGAADDAATRQYAESLVHLVHSLEMTVLAQGVQDARDLATLWALGFDGVTGPAVPMPVAFESVATVA